MSNHCQSFNKRRIIGNGYNYLEAKVYILITCRTLALRNFIAYCKNAQNHFIFRRVRAIHYCSKDYNTILVKIYSEAIKFNEQTFLYFQAFSWEFFSYQENIENTTQN